MGEKRIILTAIVKHITGLEKYSIQKGEFLFISIDTSQVQVFNDNQSKVIFIQSIHQLDISNDFLQIRTKDRSSEKSQLIRLFFLDQSILEFETVSDTNYYDYFKTKNIISDEFSIRKQIAEIFQNAPVSLPNELESHSLLIEKQISKLDEEMYALLEYVESLRLSSNQNPIDILDQYKKANNRLLQLQRGCNQVDSWLAQINSSITFRKDGDYTEEMFQIGNKITTIKLILKKLTEIHDKLNKIRTEQIEPYQISQDSQGELLKQDLTRHHHTINAIEKQLEEISPDFNKEMPILYQLSNQIEELLSSKKVVDNYLEDLRTGMIEEFSLLSNAERVDLISTHPIGKLMVDLTERLVVEQEKVKARIKDDLAILQNNLNSIKDVMANSDLSYEEYQNSKEQTQIIADTLNKRPHLMDLELEILRNELEKQTNFLITEINSILCKIDEKRDSELDSHSIKQILSQYNTENQFHDSIKEYLQGSGDLGLNFELTMVWGQKLATSLPPYLSIIAKNQYKNLTFLSVLFSSFGDFDKWLKKNRTIIQTLLFETTELIRLRPKLEIAVSDEKTHELPLLCNNALFFPCLVGDSISETLIDILKNYSRFSRTFQEWEWKIRWISENIDNKAAYEMAIQTEDLLIPTKVIPKVRTVICENDKMGLFFLLFFEEILDHFYPSRYLPFIQWYLGNPALNLIQGFDYLLIANYILSFPSKKRFIFELIDNFGEETQKLEEMVAKTHFVDQLIYQNLGEYCPYQFKPGSLDSLLKNTDFMESERETNNYFCISSSLDLNDLKESQQNSPDSSVLTALYTKLIKKLELMLVSLNFDNLFATSHKISSHDSEIAFIYCYLVIPKFIPDSQQMCNVLDELHTKISAHLKNIGLYILPIFSDNDCYCYIRVFLSRNRFAHRTQVLDSLKKFLMQKFLPKTDVHVMAGKIEELLKILSDKKNHKDDKFLMHLKKTAELMDINRNG